MPKGGYGADPGIVDCETALDFDGTPMKGSKFCKAIRMPTYGFTNCATESDLKVLSKQFPSMDATIAHGCYDGVKPGSKLCLCSTDGCNSGI